MFSELTPVATLPVTDMARARKFYEETLGLTASGIEEMGGGGVNYDCGGSKVFVYQSSFAGTNKATAVTFDCPPDKFLAEVDSLRSKGVSFMTFEFEGMEWDGEVAKLGPNGRAVWFTDPDGNIINISSM